MQGNIFFSFFIFEDHWVTGDPWILLGYFFWSINGKNIEPFSSNVKSKNDINKLENNATNEQIK